MEVTGSWMALYDWPDELLLRNSCWRGFLGSTWQKGAHRDRWQAFDGRLPGPARPAPFERHNHGEGRRIISRS